MGKFGDYLDVEICGDVWENDLRTLVSFAYVQFLEPHVEEYDLDGSGISSVDDAWACHDSHFHPAASRCDLTISSFWCSQCDSGVDHGFLAWPDDEVVYAVEVVSGVSWIGLCGYDGV